MRLTIDCAKMLLENVGSLSKEQLQRDANGENIRFLQPTSLGGTNPSRYSALTNNQDAWKHESGWYRVSSTFLYWDVFLLEETMKQLKGNEVRSMFLEYFKEHGHMIEPGASLIPHNDPTLLWINAGVAALKKYFDGS